MLIVKNELSTRSKVHIIYKCHVNNTICIKSLGQYWSHRLKELGLHKAESFYKCKTKVHTAAQKSVTHEAITMDFHKNISLLQVTTNYVYYKTVVDVHI